MRGEGGIEGTEKGGGGRGKEGQKDLSNIQVGNIIKEIFRGYRYEVLHINLRDFFVSYLLFSTFISSVFYF